jgi:hypothetical protein
LLGFFLSVESVVDFTVAKKKDVILSVFIIYGFHTLFLRLVLNFRFYKILPLKTLKTEKKKKRNEIQSRNEEKNPQRN